MLRICIANDRSIDVGWAFRSAESGRVPGRDRMVTVASLPDLSLHE